MSDETRPPLTHAPRASGGKWVPAKSLCNRMVSARSFPADPADASAVTCKTCRRRLVQRLATGSDDGEPAGGTEP